MQYFPVRKSNAPHQVGFKESIHSSRPLRSTASSNNSQSQSSRTHRPTAPVEHHTYSHDKSSLTGRPSRNLALIDSYVLNIAPSNCDAKVLKASKDDHPDLFSYEEAMSGEHRTEWIEATKKKFASLESLKCWEEITIDQATTKVLPEHGYSESKEHLMEASRSSRQGTAFEVTYKKEILIPMHQLFHFRQSDCF
jgi:hypothetical protein